MPRLKTPRLVTGTRIAVASEQRRCDWFCSVLGASMIYVNLFLSISNAFGTHFSARYHSFARATEGRRALPPPPRPWRPRAAPRRAMPLPCFAGHESFSITQ